MINSVGRRLAPINVMALGVLTAALLAHCSSSETAPKPPTGSLSVTITAPAGVAPDVLLTDTLGDYIRVLTATQDLSLPAGAYLLTINGVRAAASLYVGSVASEVVVLNPGERTTAAVTYVAAASLTVTIAAPAGVKPNVVLTDPAGLRRVLTASQTVTGLRPGAYTLTANKVTSGALIYVGTVLSEPVVLTAGATATAHVAYVPAAALKVTIAAPAGVIPSVLVTDSAGNFAQTLSATQTLTGLTPGIYTVVADSVVFASRAYGASVSGGAGTLIPGDTAAASVSYSTNMLAPATGTLIVAIANVGSAQVSVTGPVGYGAMINVTSSHPDTLSGLVPGRYTATGRTGAGPVLSSRDTAQVANGSIATIRLSRWCGISRDPFIRVYCFG